MKKKKRNKTFSVFLTVFFAVTLLGMLTLFGIYFLQDRKTDEESAVETITQTEELETTRTSEEITIESDWIEEEIREDDAKVKLPEGVFRLETAKEDSALLAFAGDILFDDSYSPMVRLKQRGGDINTCFSPDLMQEMQGADLFVLNNEFTYTDRGVATAEKQYTFRAKPEHARMLKEMGVDMVSLANNHAYDYGEISLLDTIDTLEREGIAYGGAGKNIEEASKPVVYLAGDVRIAIVCTTQIERQDNPDTKGAGETTAGVFRCWNPEKMYETIAQAKRENDFVIAYIHWGTENTTELDWAQREQAKGLVEAGADLILGNHPHCLQEVGYIDGVPIIYSLGNYWFNSRTVDTCLVKAVITKEGLSSLQLLPAIQADCKTTLLQGSEKARVISYVNSLSKTAVLDEDGYMFRKTS